jgi:VanZ family protein
LFPIALGGIIEILQEMFFNPRSGEWLDWLTDIAGVLTAWAVFFFRGKSF